jgi:hypothetical protein
LWYELKKFWNEEVASAYGTNYRRRSHAKDAKPPRAQREENGDECVVSQIIVNKINFDIKTII